MERIHNIFFFFDENFVDIISFLWNFFKNFVWEKIKLFSPNIYFFPSILILFSEKSTLLLEIFMHSDYIIQSCNCRQQIITMGCLILNFSFKLFNLSFMLSLPLFIFFFKHTKLFPKSFDFIKVHFRLCLELTDFFLIIFFLFFFLSCKTLFTCHFW